MSEKRALRLAAAMGGALLLLAIVLPHIGIRPYGDAAIRDRIAQDDDALCTRLGLGQANDPRSAQCVARLANSPQRREQLIVAYSRF